MKKILTICLALYATNAAGLSCLEPSPGHRFQSAVEDGRQGEILKGTFEYQYSSAMRANFDNGKRSFKIRAAFSGHRLTPEGFSEPLETVVTLLSDCSPGFCEDLAQDREHIAFAEKTLLGWRLPIGWCTSRVLSADEDTVSFLETCARGEYCQTSWGAFFGETQNDP